MPSSFATEKSKVFTLSIICMWPVFSKNGKRPELLDKVSKREEWGGEGTDHVGLSIFFFTVKCHAGEFEGRRTLSVLSKIDHFSCCSEN